MKTNPLIESIANIEIMKFESELEAAYLKVKLHCDLDMFEALMESLYEDIDGCRQSCAAGTPDVVAAFMMSVMDTDNYTCEENNKLKLSLQAALWWKRLKV